jgi:hypothetical protein
MIFEAVFGTDVAETEEGRKFGMSRGGAEYAEKNRKFLRALHASP